MTLRGFRSLGVVLLAIISAVTLGVTSTVRPAWVAALKTVTAEAALLAGDEVALIMGGSGLPIPGEDYIQALFEKYLVPNGLVGYDPEGLFTPEGLYPLTGVKSLPLDTSVDQGVTILDKTLADHFPEGQVAVLGYSQSAVISSLEMENLAEAANAPDADELSFVLLGDPMAPNGGLLSRFPDLTLPSLGVDFYGATPDETVYETDIYTLEYDGFADFPHYPINLLADLNALLGIATIHGSYPELTEEQIENAILLPGSASYDYSDYDAPEGFEPAVATDYYMIEQTPPLVALLDQFSEPLGDLLGPALTYLINLGYGDGSEGWTQTPANVPTEFGLFPDVSIEEVLTTLGKKLEAGFDDLTDGTDSYSSAATPDGGTDVVGDATDSLPSLTEIVNTFSDAAATAYATLLPTADIINALTISLPAYDAELFTDALQDGDLLEALGDPLAANTGLITLGLGFEAMVLVDAVSSISEEFSDLF